MVTPRGQSAESGQRFHQTGRGRSDRSYHARMNRRTPMRTVVHPLRAALLLASLACAWSLPARSASQDAAPIVTVNPVVLQDAAQGKEILLRVTAPVKGRNLPIILFSHGAQYSKDDYLPLTEFWASHGYVVIQPTHIESLALGLPRNDPRIQDAWKTRVLDLRKALDSLAEIEKQAPMLKGRMDRKRVLAAGHSFGGHTTAVLRYLARIAEFYAAMERPEIGIDFASFTGHGRLRSTGGW